MPLIWYKTPTDDITDTSNDCRHQNDLPDGSANAVNSNWTDGEDEDVLSSLLAMHSFAQNDALRHSLHDTGIADDTAGVA